MTRLRPAVLSLLFLGVVALLFTACGGDDGGGGAEGKEASASTDVNTLLEQTFTGSKEVKSGNLKLAMSIKAQGGDAEELEGPVNLSLEGPFQAQGKGKLPKFKLDASFEGAGQKLSAGATSTGEKGYVSFQGTDYVLEDQIFQQFRAGFEEAQKQGGGEENQSFASLGMDPRKWLTGAKNAGDAKVGDEDTIKITGGVDMAKLLDDVNTALGKASSLGLGATGEVPEKLTADQRKQVLDAVKDPKVEIYTGKDDSILRRLVVDLGIEEASSGTTGTIAFDVSIENLNEDQEIAEPSDAKPFNELLGQLGGLGALSGGSGASGSGSSDDGGAAAGGSTEDLEAYSKCLTDAGSDVDAARKCADLLTG